MRLVYLALHLIAARCHPIPAAYTSQRDCYKALLKSGNLQMCQMAAMTKWNLLDDVHTLDATCCAIHEAFNCVLAHTCATCAEHDLAVWANYRMRALKALNLTLCSRLDIASSWSDYCGGKLSFGRQFRKSLWPIISSP